jgi:RNA polymerase primary sigma factor
MTKTEIKEQERQLFQHRLDVAIPRKFPHRDSIISVGAMDLRFFLSRQFDDQDSLQAILNFRSISREELTAAWNAALRDADYESSPESKKIVLTPEEERTIFLRYNYARSRVAPLFAVAQQRKLTRVEAQELAHWTNILKYDRDVLVIANLGLVFSMGRRYGIFSGGDMTELVSEGIGAVMRSVDCFNVERGYKFSTYACRSIVQAMNRAKGKAASRQARSTADITPDTKVTVEKPESDELRDLKNVLEKNAARLTKAERAVVRQRFFEGKKLHEVGGPLGVTKERVRQIQNKALRKLKAVLV